MRRESFFANWAHSTFLWVRFWSCVPSAAPRFLILVSWCVANTSKNPNFPSLGNVPVVLHPNGSVSPNSIITVAGPLFTQEVSGDIFYARVFHSAYFGEPPSSLAHPYLSFFYGWIEYHYLSFVCQWPFGF